MRQNPFSFEPTHKVWIYGNDKPIISGSNTGIKRRMRLIDFPVKIPANTLNEDFDALLIPEMSGILNWALRGCLEWQKRGLKPVETVSHATTNYIDEMDWLQTFIDDYCIVDPKERCMFKYLYQAYVTKCKSLSEYAYSKHEFQERLIKKDFKFKNGTGNQLYIFGIRHLTQLELIKQFDTANLELATMEIA
jgi:putative DNA primase/helicase